MHVQDSPRNARALLLALCAATLASPAGAQLQDPGRPGSESWALASEVPTSVLPPVDVGAYLAEDERNGQWPLRYGARIPLALGLDAGGVVDAAPDGSFVWRARIQSPGALSLGLEFDSFELPEGAELFVYDPARERTLGAFTARNNKPSGTFQVAPVRGAELVVEYVQPAWVAESARLRIGHVIHDYRGILQSQESSQAASGPGGGGVAACLIDVNCPDAAAYQDEKRAVVRILAGGMQCTGVLLNNTLEDERQLLLTANSCGDLDDAVFTFNNELPTCGAGVAPDVQTVQGSTLLATSTFADYRLVEITEAIPASYDVYYAGWKRSAGIPNKTVSIHHPSAGPKAFAADALPPQKVVHPMWTVLWTAGALDAGSAGAPLMNGQGLVMGPLSSVDQEVCGQQYAFFGRMDQFWEAVDEFLDPVGIAPTTYPGITGTPQVAPNFEITGVSPDVLPAITVDGPQPVDVFGDGFTTVTGVAVNGVALDGWPPEFLVLDDDHLQILDWPRVPTVGTVPIELTAGTSTVSTSVTVQYNNPPAFDLVGSQQEGGFLFLATGLDFTMSSVPGDVHFLAFSGSNNPSPFPGFVTWDIGNNFFALFDLGYYIIPPQGWINLVFPVSGNLVGITIYFQTAVFEILTPEIFPLTMTGVQSGQFLF